MRQIREEGFDYCEMPPSGPVVDQVAELWTMRARRCMTAVEAKLPSASAEILFNLGPTGRHVVGPEAKSPSSTHRGAWVVGPHTGVLLMAKEIADSHVVGVRLQPDAIPGVLGVPAAELRGRVVDLEAFWGAEVARIREDLHAMPDPGRRAALLEQEIAIRAREAVDDRIGVVRTLRGAIDRGDGSKLGAIARRFDLTHRRLIGLFEHAVGLKPKEYQQVRRVETVMSRAVAGVERSWARVACELGYFDQAHLANEFRRLTGLTLSQYAARRSAVGVGVVRHHPAPGV